MQEKLRDILEQLKQQLAADKKKAAILGVLSLVLIIALLRAMIGGSTPAPAKAVPVAKPTPPPASPDPITPTMRPTPEAVQSLQIAMTRMSSLADHWSAAQEWSAEKAQPESWNAEDAPVEIKGLSRTLLRDPFNAVDWKLFSPPPPPGGATPIDLVPRRVRKKGPSFWAKLRKNAAERYRAQQANRADFEKALAQFELQSTLTGPKPSAYISGRFVHEGDRIDGFSVVRIQERRVTMRKGDQSGELVLP